MKIAVIGAGGVGGYFGGRLGEKYGVATPVNRFVYNCILPMEIKARKRQN
jgi:ketopantoate reductase